MSARKKGESFADYIENRAHLRNWTHAPEAVGCSTGFHLQIRGRVDRRAETHEIVAMAAAAPDMFLSMQSFFANWPQFDPESPECGNEVNGADLVEWLADQAPYWHDALKKAVGEP